MSRYAGKRFTSKLDAQQSAKPVYSCGKCRAAHPAPMVAQCSKCNHQTTAMVRVPGKKRNNTCPNCARPTLKNRRLPPLACKACGWHEFDYFPSTSEHAYFAQLAMLQDHGRITDLRMQVPFIIQLKGGSEICRYVADFVYRDIEPDGTVTDQRVIDVKGHEAAASDVFKLKKKLVEAFYPGVTIEVVTP